MGTVRYWWSTSPGPVREVSWDQSQQRHPSCLGISIAYALEVFHINEGDSSQANREEFARRKCTIRCINIEIYSPMLLAQRGGMIVNRATDGSSKDKKCSMGLLFFTFLS